MSVSSPILVTPEGLWGAVNISSAWKQGPSESQEGHCLPSRLLSYLGPVSGVPSWDLRPAWPWCARLPWEQDELWPAVATVCSAHPTHTHTHPTPRHPGRKGNRKTQESARNGARVNWHVTSCRVQKCVQRPHTSKRNRPLVLNGC